MKTDTELQREVIAELNWDPAINAADIGVEVKDGVVTLAGHVASYAEKWDAERAAQRVFGVKALAVEMDVKLAGFSKRSDADIAQAAENVLQWVTYLPTNAVKVMVENGWITLTGEVDWAYQRESAAREVRHLMGVTGVSDDISLKPKASSAAVKNDIEAALKRRAATDANNISVEVEDDHVTLSGTVHSFSEKELAKLSAWAAPGIRKVVDKMTVIF